MKNKFEINEIVGMRKHLDHCFGRIILGQVREDGWYYLIDESPHNISQESASFLVANATNYAKDKAIEPGLAHSCGWWKESKLKKRKSNTVCKCEFCKKHRKT